MLDKVLVPLDGSPQAEEALPYAKAIGRDEGTSITLYHVVDLETLERHDPDHAPFIEQMLMRAETRARDYLHSLQTNSLSVVPRTDVKLGTGPAAKTIVDDAVSGGYDVIAMSTHGRSGLERWVLGSVADKVLHSTTLPLLLVHPGEPTPTQAPEVTLRRVLVPLDGSELAEQAIPYAIELAKRLNVHIELLRVVRYQMGAGFGLYVEDPSGMLEEAVKSYLSEIEKQVREKGVQTSANVLWGFPGARVVDAAQAEPGTIVVMSSHGRSGVGRWVLGSIADKIVRSADVPVLIVHST